MCCPRQAIHFPLHTKETLDKTVTAPEEQQQTKPVNCSISGAATRSHSPD